MEEIEKNPRLFIHDKRNLFAALLAMLERLLMLNKFPVDQEDFALSLQPPSTEAAWREINTEQNKYSLSPKNSQHFIAFGKRFLLHEYPKPATIFMTTTQAFDISNARRHQSAVTQWCDRQIRLEDQLLRSARVLKAIVGSCNTVGQYKRVSPELLTFLPEKYRAALQDYTKASPYPAMNVDPHEVDTTLSTLAYAALQPPHLSEEEYTSRPKWHHNAYTLMDFPRSVEYVGEAHRNLGL